jgi:hypothetical protein
VSCGLSDGNLADTTSQTSVLPPVAGRTILVAQPKSGLEVCIKDYVEQAEKCSGEFAKGDATKPQTFSQGTCTTEGLQKEVKAGGSVSLVCKKGGKSCFDSPDIKVTDGFQFKIKEVSLNAILGQDGSLALTLKQGTSCADARSERARILKRLNTCSLVDAVKLPAPAASGSKGGAKLTGDLLLAGAGVPPQSGCSKLMTASARMNCYVAESAIEVYDLNPLAANVEAVKRGEVLPNRCYVGAPRAPEGKEPLHHLVYRSGNSSNFSGAFAKDGSVTLEGNSIDFSFGTFQEFNSSQWSSGLGIITKGSLAVPATSTVDEATGVLPVSLFRIIRFVPRSWCAQAYLGLSEIALDRVPDAVAPAPAPAPGDGGSGGAKPDVPTKPNTPVDKVCE